MSGGIQRGSVFCASLPLQRDRLEQKIPKPVAARTNIEQTLMVDRPKRFLKFYCFPPTTITISPFTVLAEK